MSEGESARQQHEERRPALEPAGGRVERAVALLIVVLIAKRIAYHLSYLVRDPFALATFSDGQLYELAARDLLAHPPFGSQPFYLQGLYAYLLALPMSAAQQVVIGLLLQLVLAAGALLLFHRAATSSFGAVAGGLSTAFLLAFHELAFYENKYLSVSLGASCNILALWAALHYVKTLRWPALLGAGVALGLAALGRGNLLLAAPFTLAAVLLATRGKGRPKTRTLLVFSIGLVLALAPMALRNAVVTGRPDVFPSHSGGIPFFIGNNPAANGRWNNAGGLLSGQVGRERIELAEHLGIRAGDRTALDHAVGEAMRERAFRFIREQPGAWLRLELQKLWLTFGNYRFVRDYDIRGEAELIGAWHAVGLPFGVLLGAGVLGLAVLLRRARRERAERARYLAIVLILCGQAFAVLAANLLFFTSAQNRMPLGIPLAFVAGPALLSVIAAVRRLPHPAWEAPRLALGVACLLAVQAFVPRAPRVERPSSVHYFNLGSVEEAIGRLDAAAENYRRAAERNPAQPMFHLVRARALRQLGRKAEAEAALQALAQMQDVPWAVRNAAAQEQALLNAQPELP